MIKKIVGWLVLVPLCAVLILFALANRHFIVINFNPFVAVEPQAAPGFGVPLFVVLYVVLLVGVLLGGIASWFAQARHRSSERHWRREAHALQSELATVRKAPGIGAAAPLTEVDDLLELR